MYESFPWHLVNRIGVYSATIKAQAEASLADGAHQPPVTVQSTWYYGVDNPEKQLELVPGAVADGTRFLSEHPDTLRRFERVADLVQGFETPFGLELLSTVHWVVTREGAQNLNEACERAYAWSERKQRFSPVQLRLAWEVLHSKGWLTDTV